MQYRYVKAYPKRIIAVPAIISYVSMGLGVVVLAWTAWPIFSFTIARDAFYAGILSPVEDAKASNHAVIFSPVALAASGVESVDYSNANVWFPASPQKKVVTPVNSYMLSIPKLKIKDATVVISGDDLGKSLVHYGGTGLPGDYGSAVVFGHSTLPQFYNPKNYKSIFSMLPTLTVGDEIFVTYDGMQYRYVVEEMIVTRPTDLSPLEQRYDDSYLTLITCVPPGTYWERLNVRARLAKI